MMIVSYIKIIVARGWPLPEGLSHSDKDLDALAKGYKIWDEVSDHSLENHCKHESQTMLEMALQQISSEEKRYKKKGFNPEIYLQRAFLYLFPPQSSITMGTWQMRR